MHLDSFHSKSLRYKTLQTAVRNRNLGQTRPSHFPTVHVGTSIYECVRARMCVCVCVHWQLSRLHNSPDAAHTCFDTSDQLPVLFSSTLGPSSSSVILSATLQRYHVIFEDVEILLVRFLLFTPHCLQNALQLCFCVYEYLLWSVDYGTGNRARMFCWSMSYDQRERGRERRRDKDALTNLKEQLSSYPEVRWDQRRGCMEAKDWGKHTRHTH